MFNAMKSAATKIATATGISDAAKHTSESIKQNIIENYHAEEYENYMSLVSFIKGMILSNNKMIKDDKKEIYELSIIIKIYDSSENQIEQKKNILMKQKTKTEEHVKELDQINSKLKELAETEFNYSNENFLITQQNETLEQLKIIIKKYSPKIKETYNSSQSINPDTKDGTTTVGSKVGESVVSPNSTEKDKIQKNIDLLLNDIITEYTDSIAKLEKDKLSLETEIKASTSRNIAERNTAEKDTAEIKRENYKNYKDILNLIEFNKNKKTILSEALSNSNKSSAYVITSLGIIYSTFMYLKVFSKVYILGAGAVMATTAIVTGASLNTAMAGYLGAGVSGTEWFGACWHSVHALESTFLSHSVGAVSGAITTAFNLGGLHVAIGSTVFVGASAVTVVGLIAVLTALLIYSYISYQSEGVEELEEFFVLSVGMLLKIIKTVELMEAISKLSDGKILCDSSQLYNAILDMFRFIFSISTSETLQNLNSNISTSHQKSIEFDLASITLLKNKYHAAQGFVASKQLRKFIHKEILKQPNQYIKDEDIQLLNAELSQINIIPTEDLTSLSNSLTSIQIEDNNSNKYIKQTSDIGKKIVKKMIQTQPNEQIVIEPLFFNEFDNYNFINMEISGSYFENKIAYYKTQFTKYNANINFLIGALQSITSQEIIKLPVPDIYGKVLLRAQEKQQKVSCFLAYLTALENTKYKHILRYANKIRQMESKTERFGNRFKKTMQSELLKRGAENTWKTLSWEKIKRGSNRLFWAKTLKQTAFNHLSKVTSYYAILTNEFMLMCNLYNISCTSDKCNMDDELKLYSDVINAKFTEFKEAISKNINDQEKMEDIEDAKEEEEFTKALEIAKKQNEIRRTQIISRAYGGKIASTVGFVAIGIPAWLIAEIGNVLGKFLIGLTTGFRRSRRKIWKMMNSFKTELNSETLSQIKEILDDNKNRDHTKDSGISDLAEIETRGGSMRQTIRKKNIKKRYTKRNYM